MSSNIYNDALNDMESPVGGLAPLAIVGFSLKFPQDANTPQGFWKVMEERRSVMTDWPTDRINLDAFYHRDIGRENQKFVPGAHFLKEDIGVFDAPFFGISPIEAMAMDPQHRLLLETTFHALENAGIPMEQVNGSKTGVYSGSMTDDYKHIVLKDVDNLPKYAATGVTTNMIANRISWFYNLVGPSVNLDSACSSSLMALDFACQGLRNGDCNMAVVAGGSLILAVEGVLALMNMSFLSPSGRCFSFDRRADGYSRGEGFGVVLVKRLSDAIRDRNTIRAIIRSTGSNQDGHTPGLTQPSRELQAVLIRETYEKAGLDIHQTRFFEAHGTGTAIGDPIEASAIGSVFMTARSQESPLYIGAVKANIGHLEGGSGIAGIIKTIMVLEKGVIPPNANFKNANPNIDTELLNIKFPTECIPWPTSGLRRASVASFGFGGSNAHAILDDAYHYLLSTGQKVDDGTYNAPFPVAFETCGNGLKDTGYLNGDPSGTTPAVEGMKIGTQTTDNDLPYTSEKVYPRLLVLSAGDEDGINRLADAYQTYFANNAMLTTDLSYLDRLASTLSLRRSFLPWKSFALVKSFQELRQLSDSLSRPSLVTKKGEICFVFTGQGAQYENMGAELMVYRSFRASIDTFDRSLADLGCKWMISDMLQRQGMSGIMDDPEYSQPMTTAIQIALYDLLSSFNMKPAVVLGHSSGEIAAAYAAGGLSLQSACLVAYYRGKYASSIMRSRSNPGAMMAVNLSEDSMRDVLSRLAIAQNTLCVACINSPENVTISGDEIAIDLVRAHLQLENVRARKLNTGVAYHSPQMKQYADDYASKLDFLIPGVAMPQRPRLISTITGLYLERLEDVCKPEYWTTNLVSPVLFHKAIQTMSLAGSKTIPRKLGAPRLYKIQDVVEIGPHQTLRRPIQECLGHDRLKSQITYHATLVRQSPPIQTVLCLVGELFSVGHPVDVCKANEKDQVDASILQPLLDLPSYPFNHSKRYWYETPLSKQGRLRRFGKLELLGTPVSDWNAFQPRWRKFFDVGETPWIGHHRVNGKIIYPATGMVVMAMEAANQMADSERPITGYELRDAVFSSPIVIDEAGKKEVQLHMQPVRHLSSNDTQAYKFFIYSRTNRGDWFENSQGVLQVLYGKENSSRDQENQQREKEFYGQRYNEALDACRHQVDVEDMYKCFESNGLAYGPSFRALKDLSWDGDRTAIGVVQCFQWTTEQSHNNRQKHVSHPVTLDAAGQLMWVALTRGGRETLFNGAAVTRIKYAWVSSVGAAFPENTHLRAACITSRKGDRGTDCSMFALDSNGNLKLQISHMETTAVGGNEENRTLLGSRQICFKMDYIPDIDLMGPEQLYTFTKLDIQSEEDSIAFYRDLELALLYFASLASEKGLDGLVRSNPKPYMGKYVTWLKLQLQRHKDGQLLHSDPSWETHLHDTEFMKQLICRLEGTNAEGKFFMSVGRNLQAIIRGSADPLELMFQSGLAEKHYQEVCDKIQCSKRLSIYLDALSRKHPHMSVLEVGAGTGSITAHVLHSLVDISAGGSATSARIGQYDYTDISESFFEQARNRFAAFSPTVKYQLLNIETDIGSQGYKPESYDLVVAAWVLHATRDLSATIRNVRRLLRPGGKLVLLEITEPEILRNGFAFGTLPGWWLSSEAERQLSPCVSATQWTALLVENGFEKVDIVLPDYETMTCKENSILIATNMKQVITTQPRPDQEEAIILVNPESCLQNIVGEQLRSMLSASGTYSSCRMEAIGNKSLASVRHASTLLFLVELDRPYISALTEASFETLKSILARAKGLLWVTCSDSTAKFAPELQMVRGLTRVLSTEKPGRTCVTLGFESVGVEPSFYAEQTFQVFSTNLISPTIDKELEYTERNGTLFIHRVSKSEELNYDVHYKTHATIENRPIGHSPPLVMNLSVSGLLDSICFSEDMKYYTDLTADQVEIKVEAIGINFRDVLVALGRYEGIMGMECAGTVTRVGTNCTEFRPGDRVCAAIVGCSKTHVRCPHRMPVKIPDTISTIEAASLPVTGVTAYHSLVTLARLQREESILIHSAAGGTGQMLLQIAQMVGAKVYVTVGTEEKKNLIKTVYGLSDTNIFYSRDASFAKDVYRATNGKGVDVVVNTLAGELLLASWECIAPFGRFVELGKTDIEANFKLPMSNFRKNVTFYAVAVDSLLLERPAVVNQALRAVLNLILSDKLKPASPLVVNSIANVEPALRAIQSGQNIGKTVLTLASSDIVSTKLRPKYSSQMDPLATYLIAGGLGGLGRSAARWLCQQGARNLILLSRSGPQSQAAQVLLKELRAQGVSVETPKCDCSDAVSLSTALNLCAHMPPIRGCIQATMVLQDSLFETMSWEQWSTSIRSKVNSTWNLHSQFPTGLSFFIMLASVAGIAGSMGQSNYAAGNTYQDGLARYRLSHGEKAVSIDLGWMGDVGIIAENAYLTKGKEDAGDLAQIYEAEFLALLDRYCDPGWEIKAAQDAQPIIGLVTPAQFRSRGIEVPEWVLERPLLRGLARFQSVDEVDQMNTNAYDTGADNDADWAAKFLVSTSGTEATNIITEALIQKLSRATSVEPGTISRIRPLHAYGVDSLLAVELRNWFSKVFRADVAIFDITGPMSIEQVAEDAASKSELLRKWN